LPYFLARLASLARFTSLACLASFTSLAYKKNMKIVIMAGGGGTRLWPQSRDKKPKQFCKITGDKTLFEQTLERFKDFSPQDIYIALGWKHLDQAKVLAPHIPEANFLVEPCKRDTGPAMAYVCLKLIDKAPDESIAFIPSDHFIGNNDKFLQTVKIADELIQKTGKLVDIAVAPNFPSTVLGYTHIGEKYLQQNGIEIYKFLGHTEKPDFETAKKYLQAGNYLWHASYYMWTPKKFIQAFEKYAPEIISHVQNIIQAQKNDDHSAIQGVCDIMQSISVDYAVTEKINPDDVLIVKANFPWSDIGAFDVLYDAQKSQTDENKNLIQAFWVGKETSECLIFGPEHKIIATVGIDDLVIVDTEDALLICPKGRAQDVKKIIGEIKNDQRKNRFL